MSILVIGAGYTGGRLAARHADRGEHVIGTRRKPAGPGALHAPGIDALAFDADTDVFTLPPATLVYYTVPPAEAGSGDTRLAATLAALPPPRLLVYLGTTGVYGNRNGALTDEAAPPAPATPRAVRRLAAEKLVRDWCAQHRVLPVILRVAGIYGPGRLPLARLRAGDAVPEATGPGNRIHADDLASAAVAIADFTAACGEGGTWNISDGNPLPVADFNDLVADIAGLPRPPRLPLDSPAISPGLRSFLAESRQIDNRRLLAVPGFRLRYPDPTDGIRNSITI